MALWNRVGQVALIALLICGLAAPVLAQGWVGTWATAPQSGTENGASGTSFSGQTLRQIVYTSLGGSSARVRISNAFGTQPLTISDVHIALPSGGGAIAVGTDARFTFSGQTTIVIPVGAVAVSDPISFAVPSLGNVAVSMFLPNSTGPATQHPLGLQTNYIASGDVSGQATLPGAQTTQMYFFLTGLDVQNPNSRGAVVTLGGSITDGYTSTPDTDRRWPNLLAARFARAGLAVGVLNEGISGNRLLSDISGPNAESRFDRDVVAQSGVLWVIISDDPINDEGFAALQGVPPPNAVTIAQGLMQLTARAHEKGLRALCSTLTPYQGANYWTPAGESVREQFNVFVRNPDSGCDAVVDQDAATHDPKNPTYYLPAYDSGDHLHPNEAGYAAIAAAVNF